MKRISMILMLLFIFPYLLNLAGFLSVQKANAETNVSGMISEDTMWTLDNSPYIVTDIISIYPGATLTIEPGVVIKFYTGKQLKVGGTLIARGTDGNLIYFTSYNPEEKWGGIKFLDGAVDAQLADDYTYLSGSIIEYADIEKSAWSGIQIEDSSPFVNHSDIHDCKSNGIFVYDGFSNTVIHSTIIRNNAIGIRQVFHDGVVQIINNDIYDNGSAITVLPGTGPIIKSNRIFDNINGISFENSDDFLVEYNSIENLSTNQQSSQAVQITRGSTGLIQYNIINNDANYHPSNTTISIYESNPVIQYNLINGSAGSTIRINCRTTPNCATVNSNNIYNSSVSGYFVENWGSSNVNLDNNYWYTNNSEEISNKIYDYYDDVSLGKVIYVPFLIEPEPKAQTLSLLPEITLSTNSVYINEVSVGSSSTGTFTITNVGNANLVVSSISSNNSVFIVSPTSATVSAGQSQTVTVTFTPIATGTQSANITVTSNDSDEPTFTVEVSGSGVAAPAPEIALSTTSVSIGNVTIDSSGTGTFTITNEGNADLTVISISSNNALFTVNPTSATIAAGQSLNITASFTPTLAGSQSATITVNSNDSDEGTLTITANGIGIGTPEITLSNTSVSIGDVIMGSSKSSAFSITNEGNADLVVSSIRSDADDFKVDPSSATVAAGQSHTVTVTFEPSKRGPQNATVTLLSNDSDEDTLSFSVSGTGIGPELTLDKTELPFGSVYLDSSAIGALTVSNTGEVDLIIDSISVNESSVLSVRPTSRAIAPGTGFMFTITFIARAKRNYAETITIFNNDSTVVLPVTGKGVLTPAEIVLETTEITFGNVIVDLTKVLSFPIYNSGQTMMLVGPIPHSDSSVFSIQPTIAMIDGGKSHSFTITFTPKAAQEYIDTLSIPSTDDTLSVTVTGTGISAPAPNIHLNFASLNFEETYVDSVSKQSFTIFNVGNSELTVSSISSSDSTIFLVSPISATIASDDSQMVLVMFCPKVERTYIDTLIISNNDSTVAVIVTGTGILAPPSKSCDFNKDGMINVADVIKFLLLARDNSNDPKVDWDGDGRYMINDAIKLLLDIMNGTCPDAEVFLASASGPVPVTWMEGLSTENVEYIERMMAKMDLTAEQEAAFRLALYGEAGVASLPKAFSLAQNVPNPFNPSTRISYMVSEGVLVQVILKVYDLRGRLIRYLVDQQQQAGSYSVFWDGTDNTGRRVSSGVYLYRMQSGDFMQTRKMVLLK